MPYCGYLRNWLKVDLFGVDLQDEFMVSYGLWVIILSRIWYNNVWFW